MTRHNVRTSAPNTESHREGCHDEAAADQQFVPQSPKACSCREFFSQILTKGNERFNCGVALVLLAGCTSQSEDCRWSREEDREWSRDKDGGSGKRQEARGAAGREKALLTSRRRRLRRQVISLRRFSPLSLPTGLVSRDLRTCLA